MKFLKLSILALSVSLSFGAAMPAEANIFGRVLQRKQHHVHQQHHEAQNHHGHNGFNSHHRRINYHRNSRRNHHWSNHRASYSFPRRRIGDRFRIYGNWHRRH
ncbi:MAG: hypothetical protein AAGE96_01365 [Cyanobacteria bacterium P01_G01_bin.19]